MHVIHQDLALFALIISTKKMIAIDKKKIKNKK
jgi:hypothetical protein